MNSWRRAIAGWFMSVHVMKNPTQMDGDTSIFVTSKWGEMKKYAENWLLGCLTVAMPKAELYKVLSPKVHQRL